MATQEWKDAHVEEMRAYRRKHYCNNKQTYIARAKLQNKANRAWARTLKIGKKCLYCPEEFWACLEFHHRDPEHKLFSISVAAYTSLVAKHRILAEIEKCDVICSNCHRKIHHGGMAK